LSFPERLAVAADGSLLVVETGIGQLGDKANVLCRIAGNMTLPETGGAAFPIDALIVVIGGLVILGGLGLGRARRRKQARQ
jgi:hypothetical protein